MIWSLISWTVFGLIVGVIAKLLVPGKDPGGFIVTVLIGIAGSIVGGGISHFLPWSSAYAPAGWIMSIVGAVILLALYRKFGSSASS
ncbi:MAG TPA: GlsB/YeaQ/YmgE family stress response membrane protein [Blastocatellia bacterium]|nr:GlsB/YeaQ/YmgE family stress response membrane protein [Blastocatellia bacterium]